MRGIFGGPGCGEVLVALFPEGMDGIISECAKTQGIALGSNLSRPWRDDKVG